MLIAILHMGRVCTELASWAAYVAATERRYPLTIQWFGNDAQAVPHSSNRNRILRETPADFSGVLMLDADTVPHPRTVDIPLLGKDILLAPCPIWRPDDDYGPIVTNLVPYGAKEGNMDGATLPIGAPIVSRIKEGGTGCIWISNNVIRHPDMRAPFKFETDDDGITVIGEDHAFCRRATEAGFEIWGGMAYVMGHIKAINLTTCYDAFHPITGRKPEIVITGTGRNGSGYAASRLTVAGLPTGHESVFMYRGLDSAKERMGRAAQLRADSSWMAAPYLDDPFLENTLIVHQVRHPGKVLASWVREPTQTTPRYWHFLLEHLPELEKIEDEITRCAARYVLWNQMVELRGNGRIIYRWRLEDGEKGEKALLQTLIDREILPPGAMFRPYIPNKTANAHNQGAQPKFITLDQIQEPWRSHIHEMAERYGYENWEQEK